MFDYKPKKGKCIWWVIGALVVAGLLVFVYLQLLSKQKELEIARQNLAASQDSLYYYKTEYGTISQKYAFIIDKNNVLAKELAAKNRELIVYQEATAQLQLRLDSALAHVIVIDSNHMSIPLYNVYSDSGLLVTLIDTVNLSRNDYKSPWYAYNRPQLEALMYYRMIIFRDEGGLITGSIETFSPYLKVTKLSTSIVDKYIPPSCTDEYPQIFGFSLGGSSQSADIGVFVRLGSWGINPGYSFFVQNHADFSPEWYDRVRLNIVKFIW